ncbi:DUF924 domain-containing protein [Acinetobacter variabilis]|uniref:DUF924 domain-containing protein n=2 Tax=Acinetobacter TaxID=469 RepID=N9MSQ5_9GAMM|nr:MULTISPECIES: DUF924 family protein [Acinetobacter]ENU99928.1 hypothetical protein F969_00829 [Acinetobacter variabilis]ENX11614.1 hypothetical protein F897_00467 [Acinetobacter variabilis]MCU4311131.1 DUF924 domain-containing protein [Acinetobacter variabilis]QKW81701.1 DUF924 domain-containing protein [Acinetobacter sp. FDAARGOS_724]UBI29845.1 DUF924 domain-containing protein [Acinetobacter variabilis]
MNYQDILDFWFSPETQPNWFAKSDQFDQSLKEKFGDILEQASKAELWSWRKNADGRLAEILVLDQFSRNIFRDTPGAFAQDSLALALAQEAISQDLDKQLSPEQRSFLYMPFMHSESKLIHEFALKLFQRLGNPENLEYEIKHKIIIDRFGRYPHRNQILGRESTEEELSFLTQPDSSF